jgi:hypothetical protein
MYAELSRRIAQIKSHDPPPRTVAHTLMVVAHTVMVVAHTLMVVAVISSGKLLSTALANASYDACESAIELHS